MNIIQGDILSMMEQEIVCKGWYIKVWLEDEFLVTLMKLRSADLLDVVAIWLTAKLKLLIHELSEQGNLKYF